MNSEANRKLRDSLARGLRQEAALYLQQFDPTVAGDLLMSIPFEDQQVLFGELSSDFAARIIPHFPYYHSYVLLHSRPAAEMQAIVAKISPADRIRFMDELPEETWKHFMTELSAQTQEPEPAGEERLPKNGAAAPFVDVAIAASPASRPEVETPII